MASTVVNIDLSLYSDVYNAHVFTLMDHRHNGYTLLDIYPVNSEIVLHGNDLEQRTVKVDEDCLNAIIGYYTLPAILRNGLPYHSWEFIETLSRQLGAAFGCGELELVSTITEDMYNEEAEHVPHSAYRMENISRWRENGVACLTDVLMEDTVWPGPATMQRLPVTYPVLVVGKYMALNHQVLVPHNVTRQTLEVAPGRNGPSVCGAVIYRSLGTALVTQQGSHADVSFNGKQYRADVMGCVEVK